MREGIAALLAVDDGLDLVAACGSYVELLEAVEEFVPDVVITDIRMPPSQTDEGIRAANVLRSEHPDIGVVVLSQYVEPAYAMMLFAEGSEGRAYLLKERVADLDELAAAVRAVADGRHRRRPEGRGCTACRGTPSSGPRCCTGLTEREQEVLAAMATGANNAAIGETLFISARSVEKHIGSIFTKLDLSESEDSHRRVERCCSTSAASERNHRRGGARRGDSTTSRCGQAGLVACSRGCDDGR